MKKNTIQWKCFIKKTISIFIIFSLFWTDIVKSMYEEQKEIIDTEQNKHVMRPSLMRSGNANDSEGSNIKNRPYSFQEITPQTQILDDGDDGIDFSEPFIHSAFSINNALIISENEKHKSQRDSFLEELFLIQDESTPLKGNESTRITQGLWKLIFQDKTPDKVYLMQKGASKLVSALFAVSGSGVYAFESYEFGSDILHAGIVGGIVTAGLTIISPILGYYRINLPYYEQIIVRNDFKKNFTSYCKSKTDMCQESLMFIMNSLTSVPLVYASNTNFSPIIGTAGALIIDFPTFMSIYFVYDSVTRDFISNLREIFYTKKLKNVDSIQLNDVSLKKQWIFLHLKKLEKFYKTISADQINFIYSQTRGLNYAQLNIFNQHTLYTLMNPKDFNKDNIENNTKLKKDKIKQIIGYVGVGIGLAGAYYFRPMATTAFESIFEYFGATGNIADIIADTLGWFTLGTRGIFSAITGKSTFENVYTFIKSICCCNKNKSSRVKDIIVPAGIILLAAARATPSMEFSLEYIEGNPYIVIPLTICAGITTFSASFWALKAFLDKIFRSEDQIQKDSIISYLKEIANALSYMPSNHIKDLYLFLNQSPKRTECIDND